jgi:hypothetical protein
MLTIHLHLLPRLRINGAVTLLHLYAFILWTGENFIFLLYNEINGIYDGNKGCFHAVSEVFGAEDTNRVVCYALRDFKLLHCVVEIFARLGCFSS